jgi:hypothetical protein
LLKHAHNIGWIDVVATVGVVVIWGILGFPRFMEVAPLGGFCLLCFSVYCAWMFWDAKNK